MSILRSKHSGWTWEGKRTPFGGGDGGGGGGGSPTVQNVSNTSIPTYAQPYVETMLGQAQAVTNINNNPYQPYAGQRIANFTPMQAQAFQNIAGQQVAGQIGDATNIANQVGQAGLNTQGTAANLQNQATGYGAQGANYGAQGAQQAGQVAGQAGAQAGGYGLTGMGYGAQGANIGQNVANMSTNPGAQQAYMSPYIQNALDPTLKEMQRQYGITGAQEMGNATRSGAFGGSREALMAAENQRNKNIAMNQAIGQGYQSAFQNAQNQMNQAASLGMQGTAQGIQGAQTGLSAVGQQLAAGNLGLAGTAQGMQGAQTGLSGVNAATQAGQYGLAGLNTAGTAASTLGALGQTQYGQESGINQALYTAGLQQQGQAQAGLNNQYQDYLTQLNYPYQQLGFMSNILRGVPLSQASNAVYQAAPSSASQLAGIGTVGAGLYGLSGKKKGGSISEGSGLTDIQLHRLVGDA